MLNFVHPAISFYNHLQPIRPHRFLTHSSTQKCLFWPKKNQYIRRPPSSTKHETAILGPKFVLHDDWRVFRSTVLARFLYASSAWWGFSGDQDRQGWWILMLLHPDGFYYEYITNFVDLCLQADQTLFRKILHNQITWYTPYSHYLLLLPSYSLRPRAHNRLIPDHLSHPADGNFITSVLFYLTY